MCGDDDSVPGGKLALDKINCSVSWGGRRFFQAKERLESGVFQMRTIAQDNGFF